MIKFLKILIVFIYFVFLTSCKLDLVNETFISKVKIELNKNNQFKFALIIPETGCHGCVSKAETFVIHNISNKQILFVFTRIVSPKELKAKLGLGLDTPDNIIFDKKSDYAIPLDFVKSDYPLIIFFNGNKKSNIESVGPEDTLAYTRLTNSLNSHLIEIDITKVFNKKNQIRNQISELGKKIQYIQLKDNRGTYLAQINWIEYDSNHLVISDRNDSIYVFNEEGFRISKVGMKGVGPNEYQSLNAGIFSIDVKRKEIIVPDFNGKKLLFYNYEGLLIKIIKTDYYVNDVTVINDSLLCLLVQPFSLSSNKPSSVVIVDRLGLEISSFPCYGYPDLNFINSANFSQLSNEILYGDVYNDTLFEINASLKKRPSILVNIGKYKPPLEIYANIGCWPNFSSDYIFTKMVSRINDDIFFSFFLA